jgi:esterase/lipase
MRHPIAGRLLIPAAICCILLAGCATLPPRLQESGLNSRFSFDHDTPFDEYVRQTGRMIEKARVDINELNRDRILDANMPFELHPDESRFPRNAEGRRERGILLIHGLSDSPYLVKPIGRHLQSRGFLVRSVLLPGHGTIPGDLLRVSHREWIRAVEYGIRQLRPHVEKLYLGGFSTGGALCVREALANPDIRGLVLFAPAVGIRSPWAFAAGFLKTFRDWLGDEEDDRDYARYESFAVNSGAQLYRLTREIDAAFASGRRLAMPVFAVLSADDISVDSGKMVEAFRSYTTSPDSVLILYGKGNGKDRMEKDRRILHIDSHDPEHRILDFAHVSLLMPPEDAHYGKNGGYRYCLHYRGDRAKRMACLHDPATWQGEITDENLKKYTLRRLTYNPRYAEMVRTLDRFLESAW